MKTKVIIATIITLGVLSYSAATIRASSLSVEPVTTQSTLKVEPVVTQSTLTVSPSTTSTTHNPQQTAAIRLQGN